MAGAAIHRYRFGRPGLRPQQDMPSASAQAQLCERVDHRLADRVDECQEDLELWPALSASAQRERLHVEPQTRLWPGTASTPSCSRQQRPAIRQCSASEPGGEGRALCSKSSPASFSRTPMSSATTEASEPDGSVGITLTASSAGARNALAY